VQTSRYIAKLLGPLLVAIGAGLLLNPDVYRAMAEEFLKSHALIYLSGLIALVGGLAIVIVHNIWAADWRVVITLFGWAAVIGGVARIVFPQLAEALGRAMLAQPGLITGAWIIVLALGAWLSFMGYSNAPAKGAAAKKTGGKK
jgi:hypothetical protein